MKVVGLCTLCRCPCFEIRERFPRDHVRAGQPRLVGAPFPGARKVWLLLISGKQTPITLCQDCQVTEEKLPGLFHDLCLAMAADCDDSDRIARGGEAQSERQREANDRMMAIYVTEAPIGVIAEVPY